MTAQRGDFERPASPQPGKQDEPVDLMSRLRASIDQARAGIAAAAADQPGGGGEAEVPDDRHTGGYCTAACAPGCTRFASIVPAPSAGQDTERLRDDDCGHHTWDGLMALLDQHWPEDVFPTVTQDDPRRDAAARLVSFMRWTDQLIDQRDQARAQVARVRELADQWDTESRSALRLADDARERGDTTAHRVNVRHARIVRQNAAEARRVLEPPA